MDKHDLIENIVEMTKVNYSRGWNNIKDYDKLRNKLLGYNVEYLKTLYNNLKIIM